MILKKYGIYPIALWGITIVGKYIAIECPKKSGSKYFNYKGFFSLVFLAICDAKYCFIFVDIGQYGSGNDSEVLKLSHMCKCFEDNSSKIPEMDVKLPCFLVGDEIFPLKTWLMRPYPGPLDEIQRIYNYRVSRARRTIENVFGILAARWRIFRKAIRADIKTVEAIVQACVCLHNFLQLTIKSASSSQGFIDSEMEDGSICPGDCRHLIPNVQSGFCCLPKAKGGRTNAKDTQRALKDYLNTTEGSVEWQWEYINRLGPVLRTE